MNDRTPIASVAGKQDAAARALAALSFVFGSSDRTIARSAGCGSDSLILALSGNAGLSPAKRGRGLSRGKMIETGNEFI